MAISRMQEPQQIQSGIGSLQDPRQGYFLGKLVKKAGRAVKKITKSPLGKMALIGGLGYGLGGAKFLGGEGIFAGGQGLGRFANLKNLFMPSYKDLAGKERSGLLKSLMFDKDNKFSLGRTALTGLGATALAAPFLMGGDEEVEEDVEVMDPAYQTQRARNYYSGAGDAGAGLDFMPQKKYVMQNFYAANGGRAGYANGMLVEDDEEEYIRSGAGQSRRQQQTFLNMGGGAGEAQAEQMLMMEYVKYKNKGGNLSFEQFVKAVLQSQQAPEGAGMEQPQAVQMAANGGRIGYQNGELVEDNMMMASDPSLGDDLNQTMEIFSIRIFGKELKDLTEDEFMDLQEALPDLISKSGGDPVTMAANGGLMTEVPGYGKEPGTNQFDYPSGGEEVRVGKQEGGIMETEVAEETMPMLDMGGKEKDYRETGGFVEMGRKERADDVPARLSKNEFVFTADAVRNAGGGDIDKGAEVMENLMSNLEQGGEISEESQGLEGAQAMYDQQQMLQSRVI